MTGLATTIWLGRVTVESVMHKKAVPAMIGVHNPKPYPGGTADGTRKEARPPATAGQIADGFNAKSSHRRGFQASAKCLESEEIPAVGPAPVAVDPLADDLLLWRQSAGEVRGGQGVLRGLLPEKEASWKVLCRVRESRHETSHADPAGIGCGNSGPIPSDLPRAMDGWGLYSLRLRRHTAELSSHRGTRTPAGEWRQRGLVANDLEYVDYPPHPGHSLLLALGQRQQAQRTKPLDLDAALAAAGSVDCGRCGIRRLRGRGDDDDEGLLPHSHVLQRDFLQRSQRAVGPVPRGNRLLLAENAAEGREAAASRTLDADSQRPPQDGRVAVYERGKSTTIVLGNSGNLLSLEMGKRGIFPDLQADTEKSDADEPDGSPSASRSRSLHDRDTVAALSRCDGDAPSGEGRPSHDVQPSPSVAGGASRYLRTQGTSGALRRKKYAGTTRMPRPHECK